MRKNVISVEMSDGTVHGPHRVTFADKVLAERTFRANGWDLQREPIRLEGFFGFAALKREGIFTGSYEEFLEQLIDTSFEAGADEDPTQADTSA